MSYNLPQRRLVSQDDASFTARPDVPRSTFVGSWTRKTSFDAGWLVPFLVDEILPGDHMKYDVTAYIRMATPLFPLFDSQRIDTFFFFVPNRLVWSDWPRFMGEQSSPGQSIDISIPTLANSGARTAGSIWDHFGLPLAAQASGSISFLALPFRAYNLIWNEWFRDQNLQPALSTTSGSITDYALRRRAKSHDYFTSALPWPQKFSAPSVAIGGVAPVLGLGKLNANFPLSSQAVIETDTGVTSYPFAARIDGQVGADHEWFGRGTAATGGTPDVYADLSQASGVAINTLRQAFMVQSLLERDARGGTRYVELILSHFGVRNPDYRLQRPEYIGGGQSGLNVTPVAQTAPTEGAVVGQLGAAATSVGDHSASYAATEHGYIIGLINVRTELSYQQGLHRMWSRRTRYDFAWPSLVLMGEQAVLRKEIYCTGVTLDDDTVFGYQERYHEYRTRYSEVTGLMRSQASPSLDEWHLSEEFLTPPTLGPTFIVDDPPMSRVLAAGVTAEHQQYLADILIKRKATRPLPTFGTPATLGRF